MAMSRLYQKCRCFTNPYPLNLASPSSEMVSVWSECVNILLKYAGFFLGDSGYTHQTVHFRHLAANEHVYSNVLYDKF
jgi:hypothetical protein